MQRVCVTEPRETARVVKQRQDSDLTEEEIREAIDFFAKLEPKAERTKRYNRENFTSQEYLDFSIINGTTQENKKFYSLKWRNPK